jgi:hypothetical protein
MGRRIAYELRITRGDETSFITCKTFKEMRELKAVLVPFGFKCIGYERNKYTGEIVVNRALKGPLT